MSTVVTASEGVPVRTAVAAAGLVGAIACAAYVSGVIFVPDLGHKVSSHHPLVLIPDMIATLAFAVLAIALPGLAGLTRLPRWTLYVSATACAFIAAITWTFATYVPHVISLVSEEQATAFVNTGDVYMEIFGYPKTLLCMVGFIALGVIGWRRKALARGASILFILAGLVSFLSPPWPGATLAGLAFAWLARSATAH